MISHTILYVILSLLLAPVVYAMAQPVGKSYDAQQERQLTDGEATHTL